MKKILFLLLVISILMFSGCSKKEPETKTYEKEIILGDEENGIKANIKVESSFDCSDPECFNKAFEECTPAKISIDLMDTIAIDYEIIGKEEGKCGVKSTFTKNPEEKFIGKDMTCWLDNMKAFEEASQEQVECEGPLYDMMLSEMQQ